MRLNDDKLELARNIFGEIALAGCPPIFKEIAERIIKMLNVGTLYSDYRKVSELDRLITVDYWREYDGLGDFNIAVFRQWYLTATSPDLISRARRWLVQNRYIILPNDITEEAQNASDNFARQVKA